MKYLAIVAAALTMSSPGLQQTEPEPLEPTPSPRQLAWQRLEYYAFVHFGPNTFTDREWGEGTESPETFLPTALDCRQWARVAKEAGMKGIILTAKHHDGFCLWPSRYTEHSVKAAPWRNGKGDVVREFARAVHRAKLKLGLYLSPWDRHERTYGDSPAYNRHFTQQLTELLTDYGEVAEVWFDGACGEGPNGKRQEYDWERYCEVIRRLQPKALIAICGPDIRWVGNEDGFARETEWSVQQAPAGALQPVDGWAWYPAECDVSIRPGWFWHRAEDEKVKSLEHLMDIYYKSIGRNSVLLLNVPPNKDGLIARPDAERLREWRTQIDATFQQDLAHGSRALGDGAHPARVIDSRPSTYWSPPAEKTTGAVHLVLDGPKTVGLILSQEAIAFGQRVEEYAIEGRTSAGWAPLAQGTTIGHKKLDRIEPIAITELRFTVRKAIAPPMIRRIGLFG